MFRLACWQQVVTYLQFSKNNIANLRHGEYHSMHGVAVRWAVPRETKIDPKGSLPPKGSSPPPHLKRDQNTKYPLADSHSVSVWTWAVPSPTRAAPSPTRAVPSATWAAPSWPGLVRRAAPCAICSTVASTHSNNFFKKNILKYF